MLSQSLIITDADYQRQVIIYLMKSWPSCFHMHVGRLGASFHVILEAPGVDIKTVLFIVVQIAQVAWSIGKARQSEQQYRNAA